MVKSVTFNAEIPPNRELRITLPTDIPTGSAAITVLVSTADHLNAVTFKDLLNSEFLGMWRDRTDINNSVEYARKLRLEGWIQPTQ